MRRFFEKSAKVLSIGDQQQNRWLPLVGTVIRGQTPHRNQQLAFDPC